MAITESDYLYVHKGESTYLLLRSPSHFHLIHVDANLTESVMKRLLHIYPCGTNQLRELGVHFSAFKAASLRGVVIKGYQTGDILELWVRADVRAYQLGSDYSENALSSFFSGYLITKDFPPKWEGLDPSLIRKTTWTVNSAATVCALVFYFVRTPYKLWSLLCILLQFGVLAVTLLYPDSFTLAEEKKTERPYQKHRKGQLWPALLVIGFALSLRTLTDFTFNDSGILQLLGISCVVFLILFTPIIWVSRNLHKHIRPPISLVIMIMFLGMGTIGQLNYLLDFHASDHQNAEVVDKQVSRGARSTTYDCTVQLPNGELIELSLSAGTYRDIQIGEDVVVIHHSGAIAIPFYTVETLPGNHEIE